jgi:hypothetical protein
MPLQSGPGKQPGPLVFWPPARVSVETTRASRPQGRLHSWPVPCRTSVSRGRWFFVVFAKAPQPFAKAFMGDFQIHASIGILPKAIAIVQQSDDVELRTDEVVSLI